MKKWNVINFFRFLNNNSYKIIVKGIKWLEQIPSSLMCCNLLVYCFPLQTRLWRRTTSATCPQECWTWWKRTPFGVCQNCWTVSKTTTRSRSLAFKWRSTSYKTSSRGSMVRIDLPRYYLKQVYNHLQNIWDYPFFPMFLSCLFTGDAFWSHKNYTIDIGERGKGMFYTFEMNFFCKIYSLSQHILRKVIASFTTTIYYNHGN